MRMILALLLPVSLAFSATDEGWMAAHEKGMQAARPGNFAAAEPCFEKSWALARTDVERAISASDAGVSLHRLGREKEAKRWLEISLETWKTAGMEARAARTAGALAAVLRNMGDYQASERMLRAALRTPGLEGDTLANILNSLGDLLREQGRATEATEVFKEAASVAGISWRTLADARTGLADVGRDLRHWAESEVEWNAVAGLARDHGDFELEAIALRGMAETWLDQGNAARAEPLVRRALAAFDNDATTPKHQTASTLSTLARVYLADHRFALAEEALDRAIGLNEESLGASHPQIAILLEMRGAAEGLADRLEAARRSFSRALAIMSGTFGANSPMAAAVLASWGSMEQRANNPNEAIAEFNKALSLLSAAGPDVAVLRMQVMEKYASALSATHRKKEAREVLDQIRGFRQR